MKILHLCDSIVGGTGTYLTELLPAQVAIHGAHNVTLIMPRDQERYLEAALRDSGVNFVMFSRPSRTIGLLNIARAYVKIAKSFRPDIIHAHSSGAGFISRILPRPQGARLIFCAHGWAFDIVALRGGSRRILSLMERLLSHRADHIIAISQYEYLSGIAVGIPANKMSVVLNSIGTRPPEVEPATWDDDRLKILFAGRFDRQKGLDVLLQAVEPLGDRVAVRAIGEVVVGATNCYPVEFAFPHVEYLSWRGRDGITAQMMASDILVIPSRWEGFGLVALEAMRVSLPVAASAVGGLREILDNGKYGFVFPAEDAEGLRAFIAGITREKLEIMAAKGHQRFLDCYQAEHMVSLVERVYAGDPGNAFPYPASGDTAQSATGS